MKLAFATLFCHQQGLMTFKYTIIPRDLQKNNNMSTLFNVVQLIGRLGSDADLKTTASGILVANVRLATNEYSKNSQGEWVKTTYWHNLVFWGKQAEKLEKRTKKGVRLLVQGSLIYREYTDAHNVKREITDIRIQHFTVLDSLAQHPTMDAAELEEADMEVDTLP